MTRRVPANLLVLLGVIAAEVAVFALAGTRFLSVDNVVGVLRRNVEVGLIALAMTPVIVSGGIDLSAGALMGLAAVTFGGLVTHGVAWPAAVAAAVGVGVVGGTVNGLFVARLKIPPLIVTLGTLSLFRGIAFGVTAGAANYTGFSPRFLALGQGGVVPVPVILLAAAAVFFFLLLHRSTVGRSLSAIGFSAEGARHAGLAVERRVRGVYLLSGTCAAVAAVVYVARVGQAKADAGTDYELAAVTAVVLGGTSIFGGRGSIPGTLLGLTALALLDNGLRLADGPPELAGILRGALLLAAIGADRWRAVGASRRRPVARAIDEDDMKTHQLAILCGTILLAAVLILAGNYAMVRGLRDGRPAAVSASGQPDVAPRRKLTIAMMPKSKGNAYFIACQQGAAEAAAALGDTLLWDGPTDSDPAKQNEIVDTWATRGVDAIAVSVENKAGLSTALRAARARGIKVLTWDADAQPDARDLFVNQATPEGIGTTLMDDAAAAMGNRGEFAIVTATLTAANQNEWMKWVEARRAAKYPDIKLVAVRPCDDQQPKAFAETQTILNAHPGVTMIMAISSAAVPGAAEAVKQSGRTDVHVVGLGLPNDNKPYVHSGITTAVVLWKTNDLGYLTVEAADALVRGTLRPGDGTFPAGRLAEVRVIGDNVMLGVPTTFDQTNIDRFDF